MSNETNTPPPSPPVPDSVFTAEGAPPPGHVGSEAPEQGTGSRAAGAVIAAADVDLEAGTGTAPVRRSARIRAPVELRQGDGSVYCAPPGPCTVQITALDATLSWVEGDSHGAAAMPLADFNRHLLDRRIEYIDDAAP